MMLSLVGAYVASIGAKMLYGYQHITIWLFGKNDI